MNRERLHSGTSLVELYSSGREREREEKKKLFFPPPVSDITCGKKTASLIKFSSPKKLRKIKFSK